MAEHIAPTPDQIAERASRVKGDGMWLAIARCTGMSDSLERAKATNPQRLIDKGNWISDHRPHCTAAALATVEVGKRLAHTQNPKLQQYKPVGWALMGVGAAGVVVTGMGDTLDGTLVRQAQEADPTLENPGGDVKDQTGDVKARIVAGAAMLVGGDTVDRALIAASAATDLGILGLRHAEQSGGTEFTVSINGKIKQIAYLVAGGSYAIRQVVGSSRSASKFVSGVEKGTLAAGCLFAAKDIKERVQAERARRKARAVEKERALAMAQLAPDFVDAHLE